MNEHAVIHSTFRIEKAYPAKPEKVFSAFSDPTKKRRWFTENDGFSTSSLTMDFRVGGTEQSRYVLKGSQGGPLPEGTRMGNDTTYHDIAPGRRIVLAYTMTINDQRISTSLATFEFRATGQGTTLVFTDQSAFFEGSDGPKMREEGWRQLLAKLAEELKIGT